jgi:hypothetical protein
MMQSVNYCVPQTTLSMQREQPRELRCNGRQARHSRCLVNSRARRRICATCSFLPRQTCISSDAYDLPQLLPVTLVTWPFKALPALELRVAGTRRSFNLRNPSSNRLRKALPGPLV